jgi:hypothetical protein
VHMLGQACFAIYMRLCPVCAAGSGGGCCRLTRGGWQLTTAQKLHCEVLMGPPSPGYR